MTRSTSSTDNVFDPLSVPLGGRHLVEASAGTGKTFTLALLYVRLVLERRLSVRSILVVTFTRAATAELTERIRARLRQMLAALLDQDDPASRDPLLARLLRARRRAGDIEGDCDRLSQALASFDEAAISTIHGFCQRALEEHAFGTRTDPDTEFAKDDSQILMEVASDYHAVQLEQASPRLYAALRAQGGEPVPSYLAKLASTFSKHLDLTLLPEPAAPRDLSSLERAVEEAHDAAAASYPGGSTLVDLLMGANLNGGQYKRATMEAKWCPQLDALFGSGAPLGLGGELETILEKLTPAGLAGRTNKGGVAPMHAFFEDAFVLLEAWHALSAALAEATVQALLQFAAYVRTELPARKARAQQRSFGDLLTALEAALSRPDADPLVAALRESFSAALVDEFQDTDPVQYAIFERVFGDESHPLFLIGDPKQAIYGFRGADIFAYLRAAEDPRSTRHTLRTNWRSDPGLISAVATLFDAPTPFIDPRIAFVDVEPRKGVRDKLSGSPFRFLWLAKSDVGPAAKKVTAGYMGSEMPTLLAAHVAQLLRDEPALEPPDVAVLTRSNKSAKAVQRALIRAGVPAVLESDASVLDSEEAGEVELLLRALLDPANAAAVRAALATDLMGYGGRELLALSRDELLWDELVGQFDELRELWLSHGPAALIRGWMDSFSVAERLLAREGGERSLMNTLHVFELLADLSARERVSASSLVDRFHALRVDETRRSAELASTAELRLETDASAVRVTTIHKSKGLEYPVVYLPYACELGVPKDTQAPKLGTRYHDPEAGFRHTLDLGSEHWDAHREYARDEEFAEGMRLLYVALTRAKHRVYMVWGQLHGVDKSATGYLLHGASRRGSDESARGAMASRVEPLEEDELRADLEELASHPFIALEPLASARAAASGDQLKLDLSAPPALSVRGPAPRVRLDYRVASFSSLKSFAAPHDLLDGRDRDQGLQETVLPSALEEARVTLADFPAGTGPGHVVHEVFERYAFSAPAETPLEPLCVSALGRRGFDVGLAPTLAQGIREALDTPLGLEGEPTLHDADAHRAELEFFLRARPSEGLTPASLASVFRRHAAPGGDARYAEQLGRLSFPTLRGYLHGFIDLLFRADGRYYVVDYKTNHLGARADDYRPDALREPMAHHHYHLQYHLYVVATVRMLRQRVPDFDYDAHFGGVRYLFVRGMSPKHAPCTGVYVDKPSRALIEDLDHALMGETPSGGAP